MTDDFRQDRFQDVGQRSDVEVGYRDITKSGRLGKKFIVRNLKPFKSLRRFATVKKLRKLRKKNTAQLERLAAKAVIQKAGVKRRKLRTRINRRAFPKKVYGKNVRQKARRKLAQGDERGIKDIQGKHARRMARHLRRLRRNRRVMRTNIWKGIAYDYYRGYKRP